jgi:hypothetical protein
MGSSTYGIPGPPGGGGPDGGPNPPGYPEFQLIEDDDGAVQRV